MDFQAFRDAAAAKAKQLGIEKYELYYQTAQSTQVSAFQHDIKEFSDSISGGVCFRCIVNGKMGYASTEELSAEQAERLVVHAAENAAAIEAEEQVFLTPGGERYETLSRPLCPLPQTDALIRTVLDTQKKLYAADPRVVDGCETMGFSERMEIAISNSLGLDLHYVNQMAGLLASAVVSDGSETADSYELKTGSPDTLDTDAMTAKAVADALRKLGGSAPSTRTCPVVFSPEAMCSLLATFSAIFSSENAQKGLSRLAGKEDTVIASPAVTIIDDPFHPESPMPIPFDAEGSPTRRKCVVEAGRLCTLLYNRKTAAVAGKATTGNATKAGYDAPVGIRPFTMYLAPGTCSEEVLLAKAQSGVYINSLGGLHAGANAVSGDFSLQSAGFLIENGHLTKPVKSFTVAGNFYTLLQKITDTADNLKLPGAMGMTNFGAPSVLVDELAVAGK